MRVIVREEIRNVIPRPPWSYGGEVVGVVDNETGDANLEECYWVFKGEIKGDFIIRVTLFS